MDIIMYICNGQTFLGWHNNHLFIPLADISLKIGSVAKAFNLTKTAWYISVNLPFCKELLPRTFVLPFWPKITIIPRIKN